MPQWPHYVLGPLVFNGPIPVNSKVLYLLPEI